MVLGSQLAYPFLPCRVKKNLFAIGQSAVESALTGGRDIVIITPLDARKLMTNSWPNWKNMKEAIRPHEILLVVDAMTGQAAVNVAETFDSRLGLKEWS
jgi:signal recognition particle subunit SRP54